MERKISEYKIDEENKRMLQDAINRVMYICQINKIPAFVSVAIEKGQNIIMKFIAVHQIM